jgi:hypothetical protein
MAPHLDLIVSSTEDLNGPVPSLYSDISCPIKADTAYRLYRDETICCLLRLTSISFCEAHSAQE